MSIVIKGKTVQGPTPDVVIGSQTWMRGNLAVSKYRNGDIIPQVTDTTEWANLTTGAWCWYNNDSGNGLTYGKLYNWYAVTDTRGLIPTGYHLPTTAEWDTLTALGGGALKQAGLQYWSSPNASATNSTGFTSLPAGYRTITGTFTNINLVTYYWTNTVALASSTQYIINLTFSSGGTFTNTSAYRAGLSIRCIKD